MKLWGSSIVLVLVCAGAMLGFLMDTGYAAAKPIDYSGIYISRISADDNDEWVEIHNTYPFDVDITTLELYNHNGSGNLNPGQPIRFESGTFTADSYILIKRMLAYESDADYSYSRPIIPKSGGAMKLYINGILTSDFCWGSWSGNGQFCRASNQSFAGRFSALADNGFINVNECELDIDIASCSINNFLAIDHAELYESKFGGFVSTVVANPEPDPGDELPPQYCSLLELSEISLNEQWIEIYNNSDFVIRDINLVNCYLSVQYGDKSIDGRPNYRSLDMGSFIGDNIISEYGYTLINISDTNLSLARAAKERSVLIHDVESDHSEVTYETQKTGTTLAYFTDGWRVTYAPTPADENIYQRWQTCEAGRHINEATGNCVKDAEPPAECAEGEYRNLATGRCKKYAVKEPLADCPEGQFRNPSTNRCKKIAADEDLVPCAEGYERNPLTNRCRKIVSQSEASYGIEPHDGNMDGGLWGWIGGGGLLLASGLITWQFRPEIGRGLHRAAGWFGRPRG